MNSENGSDPSKVGGIERVREVMGRAEDVAPIEEARGAGGNVRPLRGNPDALKPRAMAMLGAITFAGNIERQLERPYLVKGWLDRGGVSVLYGPSNVGKSFLALDIAHHVAKGLSWGGRRTRKGKVLYVAAEGGGSFANRVAALEDPEFWVYNGPLTLTGSKGAAAPLSEALQHLAAVHNEPFSLIIFDTLARVMGGLDENTAPDIAHLVASLDHIRRATGAHIMLVHHTGKDVARGARGHSSLRAAIDTEIELTRDEVGQITAEVTKQRDGPTGDRFAYTLRRKELGHDQDGDQVTSCFVEPVETARAGHAEVTGSARVALDLLDKVLAEAGEIHRKPHYPSGPGVALDQWRDACIAAGTLSTSDNRDTQLKAFRRAREGLETERLIVVRDELVWRVE
ncbi:AAA family ATPase [Rhodobacter maris]|uniref:AAA domain-containing protein n=1 Tax=Rhodobacter maris TaxID=446682 RepID=A0A285S4U3_9RHOB|nr:helicase RepA family protein [Rhodobacter maris]SOC02139.1 AAA domain-containing protein [Rhodobacter maris]